MATQIFLVRHGETEANATRVVQTPDVPLSTVGLAQARRLAQRLAAQHLGGILASDLRRAVMTAECVRDASGAPVQLDDLLQERNFGEIRGRPYSTLDVGLLDPAYHPPGGESWEMFHQRVDRAWAAVRAAAEALPAGRSLAVITHGLVLYSLVARHLAPGEDHSAAFANTSVTAVERNPDWRITRINCTAHLDRPDAGVGSGPV
jgi:probable phosphoglycerate mutase